MRERSEKLRRRWGRRDDIILCERGLGKSDADGADVMTLFYAGEVWDIETPHPVMITRQTPKFLGDFPEPWRSECL